MKTEPLTSMQGTANLLSQFSDLEITVEVDTFTVSFEDATAAIDQVDAAKDRSVAAYLRAGGNPRNRRSFGAQFAAVKRAILKAAGA